MPALYLLVDFLNLQSLFILACFLVAALNMLVGSLGFIYNLQKLKWEEHISRSGAMISQLLTCIHLILWCSILLVFLPDLERASVAIEEELKDSE